MRSLTNFYTQCYADYFKERYGYNVESYVKESRDFYFNAPILHKDGKVEAGLLSYLPLPYFEGGKNALKNLLAEYFEKIYELGKKRIALRQDPCVEYNNEIIKIFLRNGFVPNLFYTSIIDLTKSEESISISISMNHRNCIKKIESERDLNLIIADTSASDERYFLDWMNLYSTLIARGGQIHTQGATDVLREQIKSSFGILYLLYKGEELISGMLISTNTFFAYYSMSGTKPEYERVGGFSHYILYRAMLDLKARGMKKLEIGPIFYDSVQNFYKHNQKELSISKFKVNTGGSVVPSIIFTKGG